MTNEIIFDNQDAINKITNSIQEIIDDEGDDGGGVIFICRKYYQI